MSELATTIASQRASNRAAVLFDGMCGFCQFQIRLIEALDWLGKLECVPLQSTLAAELAPSARREDLLAAMHVIPAGQTFDPNRRIQGARAVRFLALRLPLLFPIGVLLWLPLLIYPADWIYRLIARNRYVISKVFGCSAGTCAVPASRGKDQQSSKVRREVAPK